MSGRQASLTALLHCQFLTGLWEGRWWLPMEVRHHWKWGLAGKGKGKWPDAECNRKIMVLDTAGSDVKLFSKQLVKKPQRTQVSSPPVPYLSHLPPSYHLPKEKQGYLSGILLTCQGLNSSRGSQILQLMDLHIWGWIYASIHQAMALRSNLLLTCHSSSDYFNQPVSMWHCPI